MMISPNSISFKNKDGENEWGTVKQGVDNRIENINAESWNYWENFWIQRNINCSLVTK